MASTKKLYSYNQIQQEETFSTLLHSAYNSFSNIIIKNQNSGNSKNMGKGTKECKFNRWPPNGLVSFVFSFFFCKALIESFKQSCLEHKSASDFEI